MALSRITIIRPRKLMFSGARGGLGGTSGRRMIGESQASAMLTGGLAVPTQIPDRRWVSISALKSGRHEGARIARARLSTRSVGLLSSPNRWKHRRESGLLPGMFESFGLASGLRT